MERAKEILDEAYTVAQALNSKALLTFVDNCRHMNDAELSLKKRSQSMESVRKRRSKVSLDSDRNSQNSQHSIDTVGSGQEI